MTHLEDMTVEGRSVLGGAARYLSHVAGDRLSVAAAADAIRKEPKLLGDIQLELQALSKQLHASVVRRPSSVAKDETTPASDTTDN